MRMTLTNDRIEFSSEGIWIEPTLSAGFWFSGSPAELLSIIIAHPELDIDRTILRVRVKSFNVGI